MAFVVSEKTNLVVRTSRLLLLIVFFLPFQLSANSYIEWSMLDVSSHSQGDAHLIGFADGSRWLVDTGDSSEMIDVRLHSLKVSQLEGIVISHAHKDHYGGLERLIRSDIKISSVWFNEPPRSICDKEKPWGCDFEDVKRIIRLLRDRRIPIRKIASGQVLKKWGKSEFRVLYAYDGIHTPIGKTDINDMSAILMMRVGKSKALLTGDLNRPLGEYLAGAKENLTADVLKVPHHGTESAAPNEFFDRVKPRFALVPAPTSLWLSERSKRIRDYFQKSAAVTLVSGLNGNVRVTLVDGDVKVNVEKGPIHREDAHVDRVL